IGHMIASRKSAARNSTEALSQSPAVTKELHDWWRQIRSIETRARFSARAPVLAPREEAATGLCDLTISSKCFLLYAVEGALLFQLDPIPIPLLNPLRALRIPLPL